VSPALHQWLSMADAVAAFGAGEYGEVYCDGQFVVLPSAVLCFVTTGATPDGSHVESPSQVLWRPDPRVPSVKEYDWLPEPVREARDHHLFLRGKSDGRFFHAGGAHLGSYGGSRNAAGVPTFHATFSLDQKLPRDVWVQLGGYPGWLVEVNHESHRVDAGDRAAFERLIAQLPRQPFSHLNMTRYEEDSLSVFTNSRRGWLMYLRHPADGGMYTHDPDYRGPPDSVEVFRCACGIDLEFPTGKTLARALAGRAAVDFFQGGQLPQWVHWDLE
jgi:hypothetical protein